MSRLAEEGVDVECTAVARPDVDVPKVQALAVSLGATRFRTRQSTGTQSRGHLIFVLFNNFSMDIEPDI